MKALNKGHPKLKENIQAKKQPQLKKEYEEEDDDLFYKQMGPARIDAQNDYDTVNDEQLNGRY